MPTKKKSTPDQHVKSLVCDFCWKEYFGRESFERQCKLDNFDDEFSYTTTLPEVFSAAANGCNWCKLLVHIVEKEGYANLSHYTNEISIWPMLGSHRRDDIPILKFIVSVTLFKEFSPGGSSFISQSLNAWTEQSDAAAHFVTTRKPRHEVDTEAAMKQATNWLRECKSHRTCPGQCAKALPPRVLHFSPRGDATNTVRLVSTEGLTGQYAALSYCWGGLQKGILTSRNIDSRFRSIEERDLSNTVRDAIKVTRAIGLRYLWVDALCIIQDSESDRNRELASMQKIYQDATLTIVAASASDTKEGFLRPRPRPDCRFRVPLRLESGWGTVFLQAKDDDSSMEPLSRRGWALQEQLLSPRQLIFTSKTLLWQCRNRDENLGKSLYEPAGDDVGYCRELLDVIFDHNLQEKETPAIEKSGRMSFRQATALLAKVARRVKSKLSLEMDESVQILPFPARDELLKDSWREILRAYSSRDVSLAGDKLTALSGLASLVSRQWNCAYLAGLWRSALPEQLMWRHVFRTGRSRISQWRAPSWSWASGDGQIWFMKRTDSDQRPQFCAIYRPYRFLVRDGNVRLKDESLPFGEVTSGYLTVSAVMKTVRKGYFRDVKLRDPRMPWFVAEPHWDFGEESGLEDKEYHLLAIWRGVWKEPQGLMSRMPVIEGLILEKTSDGHYRRQGTFDAHDVPVFNKLSEQTVTIV